MKKSIIFAATLLLLLTMVSCNQDSLTPSDTPLTWDGGTRAEKNPLDEIDFSALDTAYFVSDKDVEAYIHFKELLAKGQGKDFAIQEIVPLGLNDEATLAYLLNYNEGWEIISADKRAPVVLASGEVGCFSLKEAPENVMAWIECSEKEILNLRTFEGQPEMIDGKTWKEMLCYADFWKAINADEEYIFRGKSETRHIPDSLLIIIDNPSIDPYYLEGHWEVVGITNEGVTLMNTNHLISTQWGQGVGYNTFCPRKSNSFENAPAGCMAVAGAQMAKYLHDKNGVPVNAPSSIFCTAVVGNVSYSTNMYIVSTSPNTWNSMYNTTGSSSAASLIAGIGIIIQSEYGNYDTSAAEGSLSYYFDNENISFSYSSYNPQTINSSLIHDMPVIVEAYGFENNTHFGHVLIIDRYRAYATQYNIFYEWVYDHPGNGMPRPIREKIEIEYSNPTIIEYGMNWGFNGLYDDGWYSKYDSWNINSSLYFSSNNRKMYVFPYD
ncbi:MAG: C10 family peptidase [Bacteroidaceae bacterium]|nr:C10 family peptidase [Bacteroidaceae bacterium]